MINFDNVHDISWPSFIIIDDDGVGSWFFIMRSKQKHGEANYVTTWRIRLQPMNGLNAVDVIE